MATNPRLKNMVDFVFGDLSVIRQQGNGKGGGALWLCQCSCGKEAVVNGSDLRSGKSKSCGHGSANRLADATRTHGMTGSRIYIIWKNMHKRCRDKTNLYYGALGISVCEEWGGFDQFFEWAMRSGYSENLTIDRIDNNIGYTPDNCRWTTFAVQSANRRFVRIRADGALWRHVAKSNGISNSAYSTRIFDGWTPEQASSWPMYKKRPDKALPRDDFGKFQQRG